MLPCSQPVTLFEKAYNDVAAIVREFEEHHGEFLAHKYQESEVPAEIDRQVYELYGLTADEIKIVEGNG